MATGEFVGISALFQVPTQEVVKAWSNPAVREAVDGDELLDALAEGQDVLTTNHRDLLEALGYITSHTYQSESEDGVFHTVWLRKVRSGWTAYDCSCKGFRFHGHCWHMENAPRDILR